MPFFPRRLAARAAQPAQPNLSTAIGQLKAGDKFGAQNTMRQTVGLPAIQPAASAMGKPSLSDAISRMKMGDRAGAESMMKSIVGLKKGGKVTKMAAGGSASKRADGIAQRGKTKGRMV